jgi:hypothetical protein
MNTKTLISGIVAGVVTFFVGYLIYGIIMADYFAAAMPSIPGLLKEPMELWAIGVGNLIWGILLAWLLNTAGIASASRGAIFAAIAFFLFTLGSWLIAFGQMNMYSLPWLFIDSLCSAIMMATGGAAAGWMLGRKTETVRGGNES